MFSRIDQRLERRSRLSRTASSRPRRRLFAVAAIAVLATAVTGCSSTASASGPTSTVHLALVLPLSGPFARQGNLVREGAELARDEINQAGGIASLGGAKIQLDDQDAGGTVETAVAAANTALSGTLPSGGIGAWASSLTLGVTEVSERKHVPWLTVSLADQITARGFSYVHQTSPVATVLAGTGLADFQTMMASANRPLKTVALVGDNTAASAAFLDAVQNTVAPKLGIQVVTRQTWTPPLTDASGIAGAVKGSNPDAIIFSPAALSDASLVLTAFKQFGINEPILGNGAALLLPENVKNLGADGIDGLMTLVASNPGANAADLEKRFTAATGEPYMTQDALSGYYHVWIYAEALEQAKSADPEAVNQALSTIDITSGPAAEYLPGKTVQFDSSGRRENATPLIVQWQNGIPTTVWPASEATASPNLAQQ